MLSSERLWMLRMCAYYFVEDDDDDEDDDGDDDDVCFLDALASLGSMLESHSLSH